MLNGKLIKILGLAAAVIGAGAAVLTDWVNEKKMDEMIDEKLDKRFAEKDEDDGES